MFWFKKKEVEEPVNLTSFDLDEMIQRQNHQVTDHPLSSSVVYSCIKLLSETVAQMPLNIYNDGPNGKERVNGSKFYKLFNIRPNSNATGMTLKEQITLRLLLDGNAFIQIARRDETIQSLRVLDQQAVQIEGDNQFDLTYYLAPTGSQPQREVRIGKDLIHIRGMTLDGIWGVSPLTYHRRTVGLDLTQADTYRKAVEDGERQDGFLKLEGRVENVEKRKQISDMWHKSRSTGRVPLLEQGLDWKSMALAPKDLEYINSRKFSAKEIASIFNVPMHMIGELDRATFSNIEQQYTGFVKFAVAPLASRIEAAITACGVLTTSSTAFAEFNLDALLRGDNEVQTNTQVMLYQNGMLSVNEVRRMRNLAPIEGGDEYIKPGDLVNQTKEKVKDEN